MTTIEAACKFCKSTLHLEFDDDYAKLNDPYGLVKLAACNRCADLRVRRKKLHEAFVHVASLLLSDAQSEETRKRSFSAFETLTKRYLRLIADWTGNENLVWEEEMAQVLMRQPKRISAHLGAMWRLASQNALKL